MTNIAFKLSTVLALDEPEFKLAALSAKGAFLICISEGRKGDTLRTLRAERLLEYFDEVIDEIYFDDTIVTVIEDAAGLDSARILQLTNSPLHYALSSSGET